MKDFEFLSQLTTLLRKIEQTTEQTLPIGAEARSLALKLLDEVKLRVSTVDVHDELCGARFRAVRAEMKK